MKWLPVSGRLFRNLQNPLLYCVSDGGNCLAFLLFQKSLLCRFGGFGGSAVFKFASKIHSCVLSHILPPQQNFLLFEEHIDDAGLAVILRPEVSVLVLEMLDLLQKEVDLALRIVTDDLHLGIIGGVDAIESIPIVLVVIQGAFQIAHGVVEHLGILRNGFFEGKVTGVLIGRADNDILNASCGFTHDVLVAVERHQAFDGLDGNAALFGDLGIGETVDLLHIAHKLAPAVQIHSGGTGTVAANLTVGAGEASIVGLCGEVRFRFHKDSLHFIV